MYRKISRVDIIIPVYNEQSCLERNVLQLYHYLTKVADFSWDIVIADNASTDKTPQIARDLISAHKSISYAWLPIKGRGLALRNTFLQSNADVVCYMDADLSTNLIYLKLLIEGIACGFDIAIGSRLLQASRIKRRLKREIFSRIYNSMIKCLFFNKFSDAQCGFKALRTEVAKKLIPLVENNNWFFDTEILLLAEYNKFRIFEVPVEWTEDIGTKVNIGKTVLEDILGLVRMRLSMHKKYSKDENKFADLHL